MGFQCAIAAPHELAVEAAEEAVLEGGNAIDAALAAAAALTVAYPHMCSIGGDLFALVADPDGRVRAVDASGPAALATDPDDLIRRHRDMPITGPDTVTVPGVLAGWEELAALGSVHGLGASLRRAARLAEEGVAVSASLMRAIESHPATIAEDPGMAEVLAPGGRALGIGDTLRQPALARSLETVASTGASAFYGGDLGRRFLAGLRGLGSPLAEEDLAAYRSELSAPLTGSFGGVQIMTSPPGSQGLLLLETLNAIAAAGATDPLGEQADLLARIFHLASRDRDQHLADPRRESVPLGRLLSAEHAELLAQSARDALDEHVPTPTSRPRPTGDTVAVVAADSDGRAVSLIQSVFHAFGAGILEPSTGIICHNRGACFSLDPGSPNRIEPGKRPAHTLMPVLIQDEAGRISAHGTMGGRAQPQIHAQLLLRRLGGDSPELAVSAPRFVVGGLDAGSEADVIFAEEGLAASAMSALGRTGLELRGGGELDEIVGHSQLAISSEDGLAAASDPRADGTGRVITRERRAG